MSRKNLVFWLILLPDALLLFLSLFISVYVRYGGNVEPNTWLNHIKAFSLIYSLWLLVFFLYGLFDVTAFRRYTGLIFNLLTAMLINLLVAIVYFYFQPNLILTPRRFLIINAIVAFILILIWHLVVKYALKNRLVQGVYLFSFNQELKELEQAINTHNYLGFKVLGHLNENTLKSANIFSGLGVVLPDALATKTEVLAKFYEWRKSGIEFFNHRDFYEVLLRRVFLNQINEAWFLENITYREKRAYNLAKRFVDLILGAIGFVVFLATLPILSAAVKLSSPGPVFFVQERVGKGGRRFKVYKYRTMSGGATNTWTSVNDPRITRIGKFLRMSRLDELPQFINLVLGNMSLVGPRPEQTHIVEDLKQKIPFYDERHLVKPGITGWAQLNVYAGSVEETREKLQYDLYYIKHRSILFDLEIILKTIYHIFTWQGR